MAVHSYASDRRTAAGPGRLIGYAIFGGLSLFVYVFFFAVHVGFSAGFGRSELFHTFASFLLSATVCSGLLLAWSKWAVPGFWMALLAVAGLTAVLAIIGDPDNHGGQAGPVDLANLVYLIPIAGAWGFHPRREELRRIGPHPDGPLLAVAVAAGIPALIYAVNQALEQRNSWPPKADPHHNAHWLTAGAIVAGLVLIALFAALRPRGHEVPLWIAVIGALVLGAVSVLAPETVSGFGRWWGIGSVAMAIVFGGLGLRSHERHV